MATVSHAPRKQLLVIDDDPSIHDFVGYALRSQPADIVSCETAGEGFNVRMILDQLCFEL